MRQKIVAGNWKMNKTYQQGLDLAAEVVTLVKEEVNSSVIVVLCTPSIHLHGVKQLVGNSANVKVGAQNCHQKASGAYTGENSAEMLQSVGVEYVILGHSERREYFHETNAELAEKVNITLAQGLIPIFCCGESLEMRKEGDFIGHVSKQLTESLFHLSPADFAKIVIAYEPIWAIGTGLTATSEQAQDMHAALRNHIASHYGQAVADATPILYGGSAKPSNAVELFACPDVDGGLIGGASLVARDFVEVVKAIK